MYTEPWRDAQNGNPHIFLFNGVTLGIAQFINVHQGEGMVPIRVRAVLDPM